MHPQKAVRNEPQEATHIDHDRNRIRKQPDSTEEGGRPTKHARFESDASSNDTDEIARRRALRAEILRKHRDSSVVSTLTHENIVPLSTAPGTPETIELEKQDVLPVTRNAMVASAADYNPDNDARMEAAAHHAPLSAENQVEDLEDDMFADPVSTLPPVAPGSAEPARKMEIGVRESWADAEGYYRVVIGEVLDERYAITSILGRGVFSAVVGATDQQDNNKPVAIKVTRNNAVMRKAGAQELSILRLLNDADPDDRKHIVRLKGTFEHREHFCLVFEHLALNLREVLRKFGRDVGIQVRAVRAYAGQLFLALAHLARHKVIHGDLKPDNILVSQSRTTLKLCDLGSASYYQPDEKRQFDEATAYLASRFYRAPEVILGAGIDYGVDIWAAGCTLFEMYTGQILFPGRTNSAMLRLMMRLKGKMPAKMVRRGKFGYRHFDDSFGFLSVETDALSGQDMTKRLDIAAKPVWDLKRRCLMPGHVPDEFSDAGVQQASTAAQQALSVEDRPLVLQLISLLERCLELDPARRLTAAEALRHPFLSTRQGV